MADLRFENFSVIRDGKTMLELADFAVHSGEIVGLVGRSGSGKSTGALAAIGLLDSNPEIKGKIYFDDNVIVDGNDSAAPKARLEEIRGDEIAILFQDANSVFDPLKTIGKLASEFIGFHTDLKKSEIKEVFQKALAEVGLDNDDAFLKKYPHKLSGGQKQRIQIAMAIALNPKFLLADEITASLDMLNAVNVLSLLEGLCKKRGIGILFIAHDLGQVAKIADKIAVLDNGKLIEFGDKPQIINSPQHEITQALIAESKPEIVKPHKFGNELPLLRVHAMKKAYKDANSWAINGIDFSIHKGEICAIIGQSGSGKSTLMNILLGILDFDYGGFGFDKEYFFAETAHKNYHEYRKHIGVVFQNSSATFNPDWTIEKIILEPLYARDDLDANHKHEMLLKTIKRVGLDEEFLARKPANLSGGQRQKAAFARAIINNPQLVFLDEAISALDAVSKSDISDLIRELADEGTAVFFISHDLRIVESIADTIIVMLKGKIVESGTVEKIFNNPENEYTAELVKSIPVL